jgi:hypothetical protein
MRLKLKFKGEDFKELKKYCKEWDDWRKENPSGMPDHTDYNWFAIPLIISLIKSSEKLKWITWVLIGLTLILAIETAFLIFR